MGLQIARISGVAYVAGSVWISSTHAPFLTTLLTIGCLWTMALLLNWRALHPATGFANIAFSSIGFLGGVDVALLGVATLQDTTTLLAQCLAEAGFITIGFGLATASVTHLFFRSSYPPSVGFIVASVGGGLIGLASLQHGLLFSTGIFLVSAGAGLKGLVGLQPNHRFLFSVSCAAAGMGTALIAITYLQLSELLVGNALPWLTVGIGSVIAGTIVRVIAMHQHNKHLGALGYCLIGGASLALGVVCLQNSDPLLGSLIFLLTFVAIFLASSDALIDRPNWMTPGDRLWARWTRRLYVDTDAPQPFADVGVSNESGAGESSPS